MANRSKRLLTILGPGILVAATGAFAGAELGVAVLWAVLVGAFFKFVLSEGLTRWQLATGRTLLEGTVEHLGRPAQYIFLVYLVVWSFMVAAALMSACGVTAHALFPLTNEASVGKIWYGILLSLLGLVMVRLGGYRLFEKVMSACIALMFVTVVVTAILLRPDIGPLLSGLVWPSIPQIHGDGLPWTIALIGGYVMTALFGICMVVIGSTIEVQGRGATLIIQLAGRLGEHLGAFGQWVFLIGAFGAVFSSLLGVWQSIPYLFADLWSHIADKDPSEKSIGPQLASYRWYLYGMAVVPMIGLWIGFARIQKFYAIFRRPVHPDAGAGSALAERPRRPDRAGLSKSSHNYRSAPRRAILLDGGRLADRAQGPRVVMAAYAGRPRVCPGAKRGGIGSTITCCSSSSASSSSSLGW